MMWWRRRRRVNGGGDRAVADEAVRRAEAQRQEARRARPRVDRLADELDRHLRENQFADRLYRQMIESRRA